MNELKQWYFDDFIKRNGGFFPKDFQTWYKNVDLAHKKSRNFLGSSLIEKKFEIPGRQNLIDISDQKHLIDNILYIVPNFLDYYDLKRDVFQYPNIDNGNHNSERLSKKIIAYSHAIGISPLSIKQLEKLMSSLGEVWAKARTSKDNVNVIISTTHMAFILLGHYGPDYDSCWRQGSDKTRNKYSLAQSPETFVITIDKFDEKFNKRINVARCVGFFNSSFDIANLMNYYYLPGFSEGNGLAAIELMTSFLFKNKTRLVEGNVLCRNVFHNPYGNWSFTSLNNNIEIATQELICNLSGVNNNVCEMCNRACNPVDLSRVDDRLVCYRCLEYNHANTCAISGIKTFKQLVRVIGNRGYTIMVLQEVANDLELCPRCETKTQSLHKAGDEKCCKSCLLAFYSKCDGCGLLVESNELEDFEDQSLCEECILNPQDTALFF